MKAISAICMLAIGGLALCAGCRTAAVNTIENADRSATPNYITDQRYITDSYLHERLRLRAVSLDPAPSGLMSAQVTATNAHAREACRVDYRFTWFDDSGHAVETPLAVWRTRELQPGETVFFQAVAPDGRCRDFMLHLKRNAD